MAVEDKREGIICSDSRVTGCMGCVCVNKFCFNIKSKGLWASTGQCPDVLEYKLGTGGVGVWTGGQGSVTEDMRGWAGRAKAGEGQELSEHQHWWGTLRRTG